MQLSLSKPTNRRSCFYLLGALLLSAQLLPDPDRSQSCGSCSHWDSVCTSSIVEAVWNTPGRVCHLLEWYADRVLRL